MFRFLETIAIVDGRVQRLPWHQRRVGDTLHAHGQQATLDLYDTIYAHSVPGSGIVKCRILYDAGIADVQFSAYVPRSIKTLRLVEDNELSYPFKYSDRAAIDRAFDQRGDCDDILVVKAGEIRDSSIANVALRKGDVWYTPREPLLKGTMRTWLLEHGKLSQADIRPNDLPAFDGYKLINAMLGFTSVEYPISNIHF